MSGAMQLPARLDLPVAMQLTSDLKALEGNISIDASAVNHLGALCLQALVAASRKAHANGHSFELIGASDKVLEQMKVMGASPEKLMDNSL